MKTIKNPYQKPKEPKMYDMSKGDIPQFDVIDKIKYVDYYDEESGVEYELGISRNIVFEVNGPDDMTYEQVEKFFKDDFIPPRY